MKLPYTIEGSRHISTPTDPENLKFSDVIKIGSAIQLQRERDHAKDTTSAVLKENAALREQVKRLEEELADYITLYTDWKAYATNLESMGQQMFESGYHSPRVAYEWTKAKETRP